MIIIILLVESVQIILPSFDHRYDMDAFTKV